MFNKSIDIIGVHQDLGASRRGTDAGPSALRMAGLRDSLKKLGYEISTESDIFALSRDACEQGEANIRFKDEILRVCENLAEKTRDSLNRDSIPLVLGGDHSIAMGSVAAVAGHYHQREQNIGLLWFDAHADINLPQSSISGNVHGMPLAHILGYGDKDFIRLMGEAKINTENLVLVGVRDIDLAERKLLRDLGIRVYSMRHIDEMGMARVSREAIAAVTKNTVGFHLSFDVDGCDPDVIPGSGTLVPGGVNFRETHLLLEHCAGSGAMLSMDVVELNPFLDNKNMSAERVVNLLQSAFGRDTLSTSSAVDMGI